MSPERRLELRSLTGLRAVAALAVFSLHVNGNIGGTVHTDFGYFANVGGLAVTAFFILSGTVLAYSSSADQSARSFWRHRVARIYPVYVVAVLGAVAISTWTYHSPPTPGVLVGSLLLVQAWVPRLSWFFGTNAVAWSLSCEAFFYLLAPLLISQARKLGGKGIAVAAVICLMLTSGVQLAASVTETGIHGDPHSLQYWFAYIFPPTRLPEFAVGVLLGTVLRRGMRPRVPGWVVVTSILVGAQVATHSGTYLSFSALAIPGFVALIAWLATAELGGHQGRLASPGWVRAGQCSYAFYLVHLVVITRLEWTLKFIPQKGLAALIFVGLALAVSSLLAVILTVVIERPIKWLVSRRARLAVADEYPARGGRPLRVTLR